MTTNRHGMNLSSFSVPPGSIAHKVKEFLLWSGEKYPDIWISPAQITQVIFNLGRIPGPDNINLQQVKRSINAAKRSLLKHHKKSIARNKDTGEVRLTTSDLDAVHTVLVDAAKRHETAKNALADTVAIIDKAAIPKTAENKEALQLLDEVHRVVRANSNNQLKQKWEVLLLPANIENN